MRYQRTTQQPQAQRPKQQQSWKRSLTGLCAALSLLTTMPVLAEFTVQDADWTQLSNQVLAVHSFEATHQEATADYIVDDSVTSDGFDIAKVIAEVIAEDKALGLVRYQLDSHTEVLGWQMGQRWYVGRQRGEDSGLTLVWQRDSSDQMSLSKDGIRFSRRF